MAEGVQHDTIAEEIANELAADYGFGIDGQGESTPTLEDNSGYSLFNEVKAAASNYEVLENGQGIRINGRTEVSVETLIEIHKRYIDYVHHFHSWCCNVMVTVLDIQEAEYVFGEVSEMLDFAEKTIYWERYLEEALKEKDTKKDGLVKKLENRIAGELEYGFASIGNPYLYPSLRYIYEATYDFTSTEEGDDVAEEEAPRLRGIVSRKPSGKNAVVDLDALTHKMKLVLEHSSEFTQLKYELTNSAVLSFISGEYNAVGIFEKLRADILKWANNNFFRKDSGNIPHEKRLIIASRVAMSIMKITERDITSEIGRRTRSVSRSPDRIDRERMDRLRKGTVYKP